MDAPELDSLLKLQSGVISRAQTLSLRGTPGDVRRFLRRRQWTVVYPGVYVNHTGPLSWQQRAWAAVLFSWPSGLCNQSAMRAAEGPGKRHRDEDPLHVAVARDRNLVSPPGVRIHRVPDVDQRVLWNLGPPRLRYEDAAIDVAADAPTDFEALGALADACQSRRTTAQRMLDSLAQRDRVPRRNWLESVLRDVAVGACSVLEHGYLNDVERAHGLPAANRQRRATATMGIVYRDADYDSLILELDGRLFHDTTQQRDRDMDRDLDAAVDDRLSIRLSYGQVFARPCRTAARVGVLLQKRGWTGEAHDCGPGCELRG